MVHLLTQFQRFFALAFDFEPDFVDVIIFNDQPAKSFEMHTDLKCPRKFCEHCRLNHLISYIDNAQVCIDIAQLVITNGKIYAAVVAAWDRGVDVRIVTDNEMLSCRNSQIRKLCSRCIPIRVAPEKTTMHHKFAIIDGAQRIRQLGKEQRSKSRRGLVMTGSLNWTNQGVLKNFENVVITSNPGVNARYQQIFDKLYDNYGQLTATFDDGCAGDKG